MAVTQVILKEKIEGLGAEADIVKVKAGYARNFLIPQGVAYEATEGNVQHIEGLKAARAEREAKELEEFKVLAAKLDNVTLTLDLEIGENGKAFGAITNIDIHKALEAKGHNLDRHAIELDRPIKKLGEQEVEVKLHADVSATITVKTRALEK